MRDAETITDVCSGGELPEVEIISLLEEQIPRYRLRADTITQFTGYENQDWYIPSPALKPEEIDLNLTSEQIREALNYFLLCSNRVSQMTKTYNDIEAVTRLLEEKERDLELTARIGKELLAHNQKLESNVTSLEGELKAANEKLTQLSHELLKKTELIQILTNDVDESGSESGTPTGLRNVNLEFMQRRVGVLEEENRQLRSEVSQIDQDTSEYEAVEERLLNDISQQLANANMEVESLADELERYKDENKMQHEEIASLKAKLAAADEKIYKVSSDNEELAAVLQITRENQNKLALELADFKDRYSEVMNLLRDAQEQLRKQRRKGMPTVRGGSLFPSFNTTANHDSLASELETSLFSELSMDSGISTDKANSFKKVFETVRCASRNSNSSTSSTGSPMHQLHPRSSHAQPYIQPPLISSALTSTSSSGPRMSAFISCSNNRQATYGSSLSFRSLDSIGQSDSEYSVHTDSDDGYPGGPRQGIPGVPGAADLEAAVKRLTPAEVLARRAALSSGSYGGYDSDMYLPYGCRTPDSIMSTGSSGAISGYSGQSGSGWKLPEKLQIVKPMEGSLTLAAWSQLATPTLGGLLEERPGVTIRGGRQLEDLGLEMYTLSDFEEDEEYENPGKSFQDTGSVYTFTNSTVLHPDDNTTVTASLRGSHMCTALPSLQNSVTHTPACLSRRGSTSTFSTTLGLAKMLNERGIKAVTPSAVPTPFIEQSFSPTATPCNSPDGTPPPSRSTSPPPFTPLRFPGFLSSGADLLRRTFSGDRERISVKKTKRCKVTLSNSEKQALSGIRLVDKVKQIGLETIMATTASQLTSLSLQGTLYTHRTIKSPMTQLTSLKSAIPSARATQASDSSAQIIPASIPEEKPFGELGVPARPGNGVLEARIGPTHIQRGGSGKVRPDLGMVLGTVPGRAQSSPSSSLGTVNSLLCGRKGGLL